MSDFAATQHIVRNSYNHEKMCVAAERGIMGNGKVQR